MAEKLLKYYKYVSDSHGMGAKIQLAQDTKVPSSRAAMEPDSPQNIALFKEAVQKITGRPAPNF